MCGRVSLCREAFGETLNESRDPDKGTDDRYSARLFLKHTSIERVQFHYVLKLNINYINLFLNF